MAKRLDEYRAYEPSAKRPTAAKLYKFVSETISATDLEQMFPGVDEADETTKDLMRLVQRDVATRVWHMRLRPKDRPVQP